MRRSSLALLLLCVIVAISLCASMIAGFAFAAHEEALTEAEEGEVPYDISIKEVIPYLAPMNEMDLYPCSDCHDEDWEADPTRRELDDPHSEIPGVWANHDSENRWCLDCHSMNKRDKLRLLNGNLVDFKEYYVLCEQCHKRVYREWKAGVHGKRTGNWDGEKEYMHCTQCHNPHNPPFQPIEPMPAPRKPLHIRAKSGEDTQ